MKIDREGRAERAREALEALKPIAEFLDLNEGTEGWMAYQDRIREHETQLRNTLIRLAMHANPLHTETQAKIIDIQSQLSALAYVLDLPGKIDKEIKLMRAAVERGRQSIEGSDTWPENSS